MIGNIIVATVVAIDGDILTIEYAAPVTGEIIAVAIPAQPNPQPATDTPSGDY